MINIRTVVCRFVRVLCIDIISSNLCFMQKKIEFVGGIFSFLHNKLSVFNGTVRP